MAKLTSHYFNVTSEDGEHMAFTSEVSVSTGGIFYVHYPAELEITVQAVLGKVHGWTLDIEWERSIGNDRLKKWKSIGAQKLKINYRVAGPVLDDLIELVKFCVEQHLECQRVEETMIMYTCHHKYSIAYHPDTNEYRPTVADYESGFKWHGSLNATNRSFHYAVGLAAFVVLRTKFIRPAGTRVAYKLLYGDDLTTEPMQRLNSFVGVDFEDPTKRDYNVARPEYHSVPYSDEAAEFFYGAMVAIASLADRLQSFFADHERVQAAIVGKTALPALEGRS